MFSWLPWRWIALFKYVLVQKPFSINISHCCKSQGSQLVTWVSIVSIFLTVCVLLSRLVPSETREQAFRETMVWFKQQKTRRNVLPSWRRWVLLFRVLGGPAGLHICENPVAKLRLKIETGRFATVHFAASLTRTTSLSCPSSACKLFGMLL